MARVTWCLCSGERSTACRSIPNARRFAEYPASLVPGIGSNDIVTGGGQFTFSATGTLAYLDADASGHVYPISWLNAAGEMKPLVATHGAYSVPKLSPDGKRLAYVSTTPKGSDVWVYDVEQDTNWQLTLNSPGFWEVTWAPDSLHLVYPDGDSLWWVRADGAGEPLLILDKLEYPRAFSFAPDGRLAYGRNGTNNAPDIWTIPLDLKDPDRPKPGKPEPFLATATAEVDGAFSPDGKFFAYSDSEQGGSLVYISAASRSGREAVDFAGRREVSGLDARSADVPGA